MYAKCRPGLKSASLKRNNFKLSTVEQRVATIIMDRSFQTTVGEK